MHDRALAGSSSRRISRRRLSQLALLVSLAVGGALRWRAAERTAGLPSFWNGDWEYYAIGVNVADSGVYRIFPNWPLTAYRMPLYPVFIAAARRAAPGPRAVRRIQALLDLGSLYGVSLVAALLAGPLCGGLAALLYALAPVPIAQVPVLMLESFFSFFIVLTALGLLYWSRKPASVARGACAGAAVGLSLLCRSTLFALPCLVVFAALRATRRPRKIFGGLAAFLISSYLGLTPWIARNYVEFKAFIPFENGAAAFPIWGASLGLLRAITVPSMIESGIEPDALAQGQREDETSRSRFYFRLALRTLARRPFRYALECVRRLPLLWKDQTVWLLIAALGIFAPRRMWKPLAVPWALVAYFNIHILMGVQARYAHPVFGLVCALSAVGIAMGLRKLSRLPLLVRSAEPARRARAFLAASLALGGALALAGAARLRNEYRSPSLVDLRDPALKRMNDDAVDLSVRGRWAQADALFGEVLRKDPGFAESLISRAFVRDRLGDDAGALQDYRRAALLLEFGSLDETDAARERLAQF